MACGPAYDPSGLPPPPWHTARLLLRPFTSQDAVMVHAALDGDAEVFAFDPGYPPTLADRRANLAAYEALRAYFGFAPSAAFLLDPSAPDGIGPFIGQGGLNPHVYDRRDGLRTVEFEVMYKLARPYWGRGYATEIARFWVDFAFGAVRLPRLLICPVRANVRSIAVLQRLGAAFEDDWLDPDGVIARLERPSTAY